MFKIPYIDKKITFPDMAIWAFLLRMTRNTVTDINILIRNDNAVPILQSWLLLEQIQKFN